MIIISLIINILAPHLRWFHHQKEGNVIGYIVGFDDGKRVSMVAIKIAQNYLKKNEFKAHMIRFLGFRFFF